MKTALFPGRFQPFHKGHLKVIQDVLKDNDQIIIMLGSAQHSHKLGHPLTIEERKTLIIAALKEANISEKNYQIIAVEDINDYPNWVSHISYKLPKFDYVYTGSDAVKECFRLAKKENKVIDVPREEIPISATEIRKRILNNEDWEELVPKAVEKLLKKWDISSRIKKISKPSSK